MGVTTEPWRGAEEAFLIDGLRAGRPPVAVCRELGRGEDDVRRRIAFLLGDAPSPESATAAADLDVLWLRVRTSPVTPAPPSAAEVVELWEAGAGVRLTDDQRLEFAADPAVPTLAAAGRWALRASAPTVLESTGLLDLDDWAAAADSEDAARRHQLPALSDPTWSTRARHLLVDAVEDVAPVADRRALAAGLGLVDDDSASTGDAAARRAGLVQMARAAAWPRRPAALLRDALYEAAAVRMLTEALPRGGFAVATTVALLSGRDDAGALRLAGRLSTPWRRPPNLGRGVTVTIPWA